jgi:hypothetical protein
MVCGKLPIDSICSASATKLSSNQAIVAGVCTTPLKKSQTYRPIERSQTPTKIRAQQQIWERLSKNIGKTGCRWVLEQNLRVSG